MPWKKTETENEMQKKKNIQPHIQPLPTGVEEIQHRDLLSSPRPPNLDPNSQIQSDL